MKKMKDFFNVVLEYFLKVVNTKSMIAIKDGFILTMPVTLVGSLFLLVAEFPLPAWGDLMASIFGGDWKEPFYQVSGSTFDVLAIVAVVAISYTYANNEKINGFNSAILSFVSFLIVTDSFKLSEAGTQLAGLFLKTGQAEMASLQLS